MIATAWANRILRTLQPDIQLHVGPPGPTGTQFAAKNTARQPVTFTTPKNGQVTNTEPIVWRNVPWMETYTHFTAWQDGYMFDGTVAAGMVFAGDNVIIDPGGLTAYFG